MYRIHWESTNTGTKGHGVPVTFEVATAWVREMNEKYPEIKHTIISAEQVDLDAV